MTPDRPAGYHVAWSPAAPPRAEAVRAVEAALRARLHAHAAYGRALAHPEYDLPQAERDARYAELRAAIAMAEGNLVIALAALEELL